MDICFVFNHLACSDGVARTATGIANLLIESGHNITFIPIFSIENKARMELDSRIKVKKIFGGYFRGLGTIINLLPSKFLYKLLVQEEYDIEVAFQYGIGTKAIAASTNHSAKHYCWMHGYDEKLTLKEYYLKMDKIFCVSNYNARRLSCELEKKKEVECCYNPIDDKRICKLGKEKIDLIKKAPIVFISVSRHSKEKGYLRLLDCVYRLKKQGYLFEIWLIGDGPEHETLIRKTHELGIDDYVVFTGAKSNPHAYTAKADCFICSSFSEGYSTACTEAILLNIPVLTTSVSGAEEIISIAEAGMLVGMEDEDLYEGMKKILDEPELLNKWKDTLKNTKSRFSYESRKTKILEIFGKS